MRIWSKSCTRVFAALALGLAAGVGLPPTPAHPADTSFGTVEKTGHRQTVTKMLANAIPGVVQVEAGKPKVTDNGGEVVIPVNVRIDETAYGKFCRDFEKMLEGMGFKGFEKQVEILSDAGQMYLRDDSLFLERKRPDTRYLVVICKNLSPEAGRARVKIYPTSREVAEAFADGIGWADFTVSILDADGDEIAGSRFMLELGNPDRKRSDAKPGQAYDLHSVRNYYPLLVSRELGDHEDPARHSFITPRLNASGGRLSMWGTVAVGSPDGAAMIRNTSFLLTGDEVSRAKTIRCEVTNSN